MKTHRIIQLLPFLVISGAAAYAQNPLISGQVRMSVDPQSMSDNETSAACTTAGLDIVGGFNDWRPDGTIKSSFGTSSDGGHTWAHIMVRPPVAFQSTVEGDPMTCYDPRTNTMWVGAMSFAGNGGIYVAKKTLGQNTYQTSVMARISGGVDKGWMGCGPLPGNANSTRLYIAYNEGLIHSDDLGATFSAPVSMGTGLGFLPRVGPNGQVYITYWDDDVGVKFKRSLDGGATFTTFNAATRMDTWGTQTPNGRVPGNYRIPPIQTMAVNPVDGTIVIMYFDTTNTIGSNRNLDVYMVKSTDQGTTWSTPTRLPFRPLNTVGDTFFPWIEFTPDGRMHLTMYDTSYNVQNDGTTDGLIDEDYAYSDDEGATWTKFRITPSSYHSINDGRGAGTSFLGDYEGIAISGNNVFAVYPDTETGTNQVYENAVYNPIVRPSSFSFFRGIQSGGSLASLYLKDGGFVTAQPGPTANSSEAPIQMAITATLPLTNPSSLQIYLWTFANTVGLQQDVEVLNVNTNHWDVIDSHPLTQTETNFVVTVPTPQNYIGSGGVVQARIADRQVGPTSLFPWTVTTDEAVFLASP